MPPKRKAQPLGLNRRVRPRREEDWNLEPESESQQTDDDDVSEEDIGEQESEGENSSDAKDDEDSNSESEEDAPPKIDLSSVSFGALARAQSSMPATSRRAKKNKKADSDSDSEEPKMTLREQAEARRLKNKAAAKPGRTSKHAPQEQSSKKPVSRRREILADPRRKPRDPRFDPLMGTVDEDKMRRAYAFLDDYRDSEMADLKAQIKKTKNPTEKEALKRQLLSMESRKKAQKKRDEAGEVLRAHREKEKELVAQGKQPFYLKKSAQKTQLLTKRFTDMSKGQVDRAIERKRKKVAGKERKELDSLVRPRDRR
ncbi:hypothetical protein ISF_02142 [Cordyceps fumosorosea ARSEF 2679]|uniref:rRNA biogenesis protein RRP36 n=1 Tax=Cordyceps fumosorosea (strain ARSEF 2679) TaxID=1081104 RepID=A0A168CNE0_CORFA|nr:hypothetical protein ISF_02142 [Cordyceps fumosorosea ARSEF 2679]OAA71591.1 hypothetical protein ISF_02142 [Cordyceps fumosorosea ARSEF 2679]